ncbi:TPR repeat protein [uncultured archaeon]|nr:TPR repeat protein [uncultured archaeon]
MDLKEKTDNLRELLRETEVKDALDFLSEFKTDEEKKEASRVLGEVGAALCYATPFKSLAEVLLWKAVTLDDKNARHFFNLGVLYTSPEKVREDEKNTKLSIRCYKKAVKLNPEYPEAYYNLSLVYFFCGRPKEAYENFKRAKELAPEDPRILRFQEYLKGPPIIDVEDNDKPRNTRNKR